VNANVAILSPKAIGGSSARFCASVPAFMIAVAAKATEAK
jgi:hypothetical protein